MEYVEPINATKPASSCNKDYVFNRSGILRIGIIVKKKKFLN